MSADENEADLAARLEAAERANGRLMTELEQTRTQLARMKQLARENADAYSQAQMEVYRLTGEGKQNELKALDGKIAAEQKRLDELVERKKAARAALDRIGSLSETFAQQVIEITDVMG